MERQNNLEFWEAQAQKYRNDVNAVNFDLNGEDLEMFQLHALLQNNQIICDVGCGNGRTIFSMIERGNTSEFHGIDITKGMIDIAKQRQEEEKINNAFFYNLSATEKAVSEHFHSKFDTVFSKRLLINLSGNLKYSAIENIYNILKPNGTYIMIENFIEPLDAINALREDLSLETIKVHEFNEYLTKDFLSSIERYFQIEKVVDFQSLYYFTSRIFNAAISDGAPQYNAKINQIAVEISKKYPTLLGGFSPEVIYILKKV